MRPMMIVDSNLILANNQRMQAAMKRGRNDDEGREKERKWKRKRTGGLP